MEQNEQKSTWIQLRINMELKEDLKRVADSKGLSASGFLHSMITKAVNDAKTEHPELFGLRNVGDSEIREILYEGFSGEPIDLDVLKKAIELIKVTKGEPLERKRLVKNAEDFLDEREKRGDLVTEADRMQARQSPESVLQRPRIGKALKDLKRGRDAKFYKEKPTKKPGS